MLNFDVASRSIAEDSLNVTIRDITITGRDGRVFQLEQAYIRGSVIRFFIVPDNVAGELCGGT